MIVLTIVYVCHAFINVNMTDPSSDHNESLIYDEKVYLQTPST